MNPLPTLTENPRSSMISHGDQMMSALAPNVARTAPASASRYVGARRYARAGSAAGRGSRAGAATNAAHAASRIDGPPAIQNTVCQSILEPSTLPSTRPLVPPNAMPML